MENVPNCSYTKSFSTDCLYKDFRPISLLFHLGKLAKQVVINILKGVLSDAIASNHYEYRSKVGSAAVILQLLNECTQDIDHPDSKYVQLASLDIFEGVRLSPAYSSILAEKIRSYGV